MRELDVIDVARQDDITMRMREWTEYYESQKPPICIETGWLGW